MSLIDIKKQYVSQQINKPDYIDKMHVLHRALFEYANFIKDTDIAKIEITDGEVKMTSRESSVTIACDPDDKRIVPIEILNFQNYEKTDADMIYRLVTDGDTILDIGSNIGWYSINIAKRFPRSRVLAFEPIPKTFAYLQENIRLNAANRIEVFNHGFSKETADLTFYYYPSGSGNASSAKLADVEGVQEITCQVMPLDGFMRVRNTAVDFIKCDVEGAELFVFQGGIETLKKHTPIVFTEMLRKWSAKFEYHPNEIIKLFAEIGYKCFSAQGDKLVEFFSMDENTVETNFFFLHPGKHSRQMNEFAK